MNAPPRFRDVIGSHDIALIVLDTLRYDVAAAELAAGRTPHLAALAPDGRWERRHTPGSFTFPAHQAFFAGFLPTPAEPAPYERLFAAAFPGSAEAHVGPGTWTFEQATVVEALTARGYRTVCLGGVGFFNGRTALGSVLPALFGEHHWSERTGVTDPACLDHQLDVLDRVVTDPDPRPRFVYVNVPAIHQPNHFYLDDIASTPDTRPPDTLASHAAALRYVDSRIPRLRDLLTTGPRPVFTIVCSDHGTAYGDDGFDGHRLAHDCVWTVPYLHTVLDPRTGETT
ncbi:MAG: sulfatase-like hydrolase/transferase [Rhodococcus sp.]|uniref:STM4013/SEN3800 family hydrolase n=1 Tax=Rhodococcus TaxID=1827 RepID=UPI0016A10585|nr:MULTISPECIES: STM4013/SEN3800 family hydrolase [Rhodococcus]NLV79535.1 sulfatase-like hydrolase/transferase [Rhodococcus sp. (in: high G+C Gram-positive bacteria)]